MSAIVESMRMDKAALLAVLLEIGVVVDRINAIKCPFHDDRHPSAGIFKADDGHWAFKCHGCGFCGDMFDVKARAEGRDVADILREANPQEPPKPKRVYISIESLAENLPGKPDGVFKYTNPDTGAVELAVIRWLDSSGKKHFTQCRPVDGGVIAEAPPKPWPIYNRARVRSANAVVVVEGEKCVHALHVAGYVATTSPGGAGKSQYADWSMLAGKTAILWPDNDPPDDKGVRKGIAHMHDVRRLLEAIDPPARVLWLDPDLLDLPDKGDVVDFIALDRDVSEALQLARSTGAAAEVKALLDDTASGRRRAISWPWRALSKRTKALYPQTITLLCGDPGSAKSFMLLQSAIHWHDEQIKFAILELEERRSWHNFRALALRSGVKQILDDEWVRDCPDQADHVFSQHQEFIDSFGQCIYDAPACMNVDEAVKWVAQRAEAGCRIIAIDPITALEPVGKQWLSDAKFVLEVGKISEQFECSMVFVTHPRKGVKGGSRLEDMAGGSAYARFAQTVLWLKHHVPRRECQVKFKSELGTKDELVQSDRTLSICKARNGDGGGMEIAFIFEGESLRFEECGVIVKD